MQKITIEIDKMLHNRNVVMVHSNDNMVTT